MEIITGKTGSNHVTSADDGQLHALTFGKGNIVFGSPEDNPEAFAASIIDNNTIRIGSGDVLMDGRHGRIRYGEYEDLTIDSGMRGYYRYDVIAIVYRNENGIESMNLEVIKGEFTTTPREEIYIEEESDITKGDSIKYCPLYYVYLSGLDSPRIYSLHAPANTMQLNKSIRSLEELKSLTKQGYIPDALVVKKMNDKIGLGESGTWIIISDSYGTTYPEASGANTFFDYMRELSGRNSDNLVGLAYSGCGFVNNAGGNTFLEGFKSFTNTYNSKEKVSKIIVAAGRNDYVASIDDIYDAEFNFYKYCKDEYANAEVIFAFIANDDGTGSCTKQQLINVYEAYKKCTDFGASYMSGSEAILHNSDCIYSDGTHPTAYGKQQIAKYLLEGIRTGSCHVCYPRKVVFLTKTNDNIEIMNHGCFEWVEDNVCYIEFSHVNTLTFNEVYTMSDGGIYEQEIGVYTGTRYLMNPLSQVCIKENCNAYKEDGTPNENLSISYFVEPNGELKVKIYASMREQSVKTILAFGMNTIAIPCVYC